MDPSIMTATAALLGSVVGGTTSFLTTLLTQQAQNRRERFAREVSRRETLYGDFATESARLLLDATQHSLEQTTSLATIFALANRIRIISADPLVLAAVRDVLALITTTYMSDNISPQQFYEKVKSHHETDPLQQFSDAARTELQRLRV